MANKCREQLKQLFKCQDKIATQQKLIEMQITQTDKRLFKSAVEDDKLFEIHHLTRKSVLEGVAKILIKLKDDTDKKIEELAHSDTEADDTFNQSMNSSILDNSINQSDWTSYLNLKIDKFAGPMTNLFSTSRSL